MADNKVDIYNGIKETEQHIYDSYNNLMFSDDKRVFMKMSKKIEIYLNVQNLVGDILEFGVFKGASLALWLKLINMYEPHSITKVIGFDFFDSNNLLNNLDGLNKSMMSNVVNRSINVEITLENVKNKLQHFDYSKYILVQGDAVNTSKIFNDNNPGLKIKLLYMDLDVGDPTYEILINLWDNVCLNGIILFDEYAYHKWDESVGVDKFLKTIKGKYEQYNTNIFSPTFYIKKIDY